MWRSACGDVISFSQLEADKPACLTISWYLDLLLKVFVKLNQNDYKYWDGSNAVSWKDLIKPNRLKLEVDKIWSRERHWGKLPSVPTKPALFTIILLENFISIIFHTENRRWWDPGSILEAGFLPGTFEAVARGAPVAGHCTWVQFKITAPGFKMIKINIDIGIDTRFKILGWQL